MCAENKKMKHTELTMSIHCVMQVKISIRRLFPPFIDCPAIIPRCMWEAQPYRGTPTLLTLPLSFLYIHHTYEPSQPCLSFEQCSRDMRSMQRFHQVDRGWDDVGYRWARRAFCVPEPHTETRTSGTMCHSHLSPWSKSGVMVLFTISSSISIVRVEKQQDVSELQWLILSMTDEDLHTDKQEHTGRTIVKPLDDMDR